MSDVIRWINRVRMRGNTGLHGVSRTASGYQASIFLWGRHRHICHSPVAREAAIAQDAVIRALDGPEWRLNYPREQPDAKAVQHAERLLAMWRGEGVGPLDRRFTPAKRLPGARAALHKAIRRNKTPRVGNPDLGRNLALADGLAAEPSEVDRIQRWLRGEEDRPWDQQKGA